MNKDAIVSELQDFPNEEVEKFSSYIIRLTLDKKRDGSLKNPWIQKRTEKQMSELYKRVKAEGLVFDGEHITLQSTGISYDYVAYKNKMYLVYPESIIDVQLVHEGDEINFEKENGKVSYSHKIKDPFKKEALLGGYCVIKNKRGEFLTTLNSDDIDKHRKVAKTDYIWKQWFNEMALKTVIKKAVKQHFADIYTSIDEMDNENYNLDNPLEIDLKFKQEIDEITTVEGLKEYYQKNKGKGKEFDKYVSIRKSQLQ